MNEALKGLVLAGGKSTRMGVSKATINWHGKEQQYRLAELLGLVCEEVFISCREDQKTDINPDYKTLVDQYTNAGPLGAILTAFQKYPNCAWMIIACDLPLMDYHCLNYLKQQRDQTKIATVFESPEDGLPEPLIAIWEAASYEVLKIAYQKEDYSLRKILLEHETKIIKAPNINALINVNTPDNAKSIAGILKKMLLLSSKLLPDKRSIDKLSNCYVFSFG